MTDPTHADAIPNPGAQDSEPRGLRVSRRGALVGGALGFAAVATVGEVDPELALASTPPLTTSVSLPTTTAPEQLRLAWGADPATQVTVSWSAPGTVAMPAPTLAYSSSPITLENPGTIVALPAATPLSLGSPRTGPTATSFTDGLSGQTTYHYHVPLSGLTPNTRYYYSVSDGAASPHSAGGVFITAPTGRASYRFTAFGDIGTPYTGNPSGYTWTESSDTSISTMDGVISPGDDNGAGLFHLMLADLAYANVNPANTPNIWRDYQVNASRASQNQPWMPIQGNHEVEYGVTNEQGTPTSGAYFNGPYGAGNYLARHLLPDNGLTNHDGNRLQGSFYSFQVGTVLFICLNTNDVVYQNPQTVSTGAVGSSKNYQGTYASGATIPAGAGVGQYLSTGGFTADADNMALVPDTGSGTPNLQTQWLKQQLQAARADGSSVDMIVVCEHHCALSTGPNNGVDLAIRAAWVPLFDEYRVDLVIGGHDHDYERSYPVRGYDAGALGTATAAFTNPFGTYASGAPVNTRRPTVVTTQPTTLSNDEAAWDTAGGTVYLQLGGAGAAGGPIPATDPANGLREAVLWAANTGVAAKQCATEDATWSANYDSSDNYGYAVFDVNPGTGPGETTLTYRWYQVPTVANGSTTVLPTTPYEQFVFRRVMPAGQVTVQGAGGTVRPGTTLAAAPSGFIAGATYAYQWLRGANPIAGATGPTYTTVAADVGQQVAVQLTASAQSYPAATVTSSALTVSAATSAPSPSTSSASSSGTTGAAAAPGLLLGVPSIAGPARVGELLEAGVVAYSTSGTLSFQWLSDGRAISGATSSTYRVLASDIGHELAVQVTETAPGASTVTETSRTFKVTDGTFIDTVVPRIIGTAVVGRSVSARTGDWSPLASFSYEWLLDGRTIKGARGRSLKLEPAFAGKRLAVRVTGSRPGYGAHSRTSPVIWVTRTTPKASRPRVSGKALVSETLHAHLGDWESGTEFAYRWFVNNQVVEGVTGHAFRVLPEHRGKRIRVEVTGRLAGHEPTRAVSAPTRVVRRPWTLI